MAAVLQRCVGPGIKRLDEMADLLALVCLLVVPDDTTLFEYLS